MSQTEEDQQLGPVGGREDLEGQERYDDVTPSAATNEPATPQVERLPGDTES